MITKLNTYEGVPLGASNFEDYLSYVRSFLGANFGFSTNILSNDGGFFESDLFVYSQKGATAHTGIYAFSPSGSVAKGNLFGRKGGEFYRFEVLNAVSDIPQVYRWDMLATEATQTGSGSLRYSNTGADNMQLPYRPVQTQDGGNNYSNGYYAVTLNGIPQSLSDYTFTMSGAGAQFRTQHLDINTTTLGAEYPEPVTGGRYDSTFFDGLLTYHSLRNVYDSTLTFSHTNFGVDYGGHILIYRAGGVDNKFVYIPQDISSSAEPAPGTYKVVDSAKGIIKLNVTSAQLLNLSFDGEVGFDWETVNFTVVSAEQLQEATVGGVSSFFSRYGAVYNGDTGSVLLVNYVYDGQEHLVSEVSEGDIATSIGSTLVRDTSGSFGDSVILAIKYKAVNNMSEINLSQTSRYVPDTFQVYYSPGIMRSETAGTSVIRALVQHNQTSWYNRDSLESSYFPVPRAEQTFFSLLTQAEASAHFVDGTFNPDYAFQIVDNIGAVDLNDIPSTFNDGETIVYNTLTGEFDATLFALRNLRDVNIPNPFLDPARVLAFGLNPPITGSTRWEPATIPAVLGYTPVNRGGDTNIQKLIYSSGVSISPSSSADEYALVPRQYVDNALSAIGGDVGTHEGLDAEGVHKSTVTNTANRLAHRDGSGRLHASNPDYTLSNTQPDTPTELITTGWLHASSSSASGSTHHNKLIRRDSNGRAQVENPSSGKDIANFQWANGRFALGSTLTNHTSSDSAHNATSAATAHRIILRDSAGRARVGNPSHDQDIANKGWVESQLESIESQLGSTGVFGASGNSPFGIGHILMGRVLLVWASVGKQHYPANTSGGSTGHSNNTWARAEITNSDFAGKTVTLRTVWVSGFSQSNEKSTTILNQTPQPEPGRTGTRTVYVEGSNSSTSRRFGASVKNQLHWGGSFNATVFWVATLS